MVVAWNYHLPDLLPGVVGQSKLPTQNQQTFFNVKVPKVNLSLNREKLIICYKTGLLLVCGKMIPDIVDSSCAVVTAVDEELCATVDGHHVGILRGIRIKISFN